jgi:succinoglycan biosynthesis transport protein ExoP
VEHKYGELFHPHSARNAPFETRRAAVKSGSAEAIKAALRRSFPLIIALVLLGAIVMNVYAQLLGPQYESSARVLLTSNEATALLTGTQPVFVDPEEVRATAVALARAPALYERVARKARGRLGTAADIQSATSVNDEQDNVIAFATSTSNPTRSQRTVNAVADEYLTWRAEISGQQIETAVRALRQRVAREPAGSQRQRELRDRLTELEILAGVPSPNAVLVERASGAAKTSPAPVRDSLLGGMIGLVISLLLVGIREALDTKIRSEEDIEELLDAPVLATVQSLPRRTRLVMFGRNEEIFGDAYGLLAANLVSSERSGDGPRLIAVTSAIANEGKTTTAANLAVALARRGANVVLADFDVRKPSVAEIFRIPASSPGVAQLVSGQASVADVLWNVSLNGRSPQVATFGRNGADADAGRGVLRVVPAGALTRSGSVAQSPQVSSVLADLAEKARADVVMLDTPPALVTVEMAELSRNVDQVIVVVRQGRVSRRSLRALARQTQSWRAKIAGAVLTDAPTEERHSYYYRAS